MQPIARAAPAVWSESPIEPRRAAKPGTFGIRAEIYGIILKSLLLPMESIFLYSLLKKLRYTQPLNWLATGTMKILMNVTGKQPVRRRQTPPPDRRRASATAKRRTFILRSTGEESDSSHTYWWGWDGTEPETLTAWYYFAQRATTILDIGSYIGVMALIAAKANAKAQVHAFEPLPRAFDRLQLHARLSGANNLRCHNAALSDTEGVAPFYHIKRRANF